MDFKKSKHFFYVLCFRSIPINIALILASAIISIQFRLVVPFLFVLVSNLFDMFGYYFVLKRRWTLPQSFYEEEDEEKYTAAYRIIQNMFDWLLFAFISVVFGLKYAIAGWILKWFALQDVLFYLFLEIPLPYIWTWLEWTPLGMLNPKKYLTKKEVLIQTFLGILICCGIVLFV